MHTTFIPIDYGYFDFEGRNYIKITGRDEKGKRLCVIDSCPIYFWAILKAGVSEKEIEKLRGKIEKIQLDANGRKTKVEKVEIHNKNFLGKPVKALKIFATNYKDMHEVADKLGIPEIEKRRGYDLGLITHYIIEKKLVPLNWYEIEGEVLNNSREFGGIDSALDVAVCIKLKSAKEIENKTFVPRVLAFDIETDEFQIGKGEILMVSLVSDNFKKVITSKQINAKEKGFEFVEYVKDEEELLEKFVAYVKKLAPDFLVGYFSDGFDMPYIKARAEFHKMKLPLGLDGSQPVFHRGSMTTCRIDGIVHIDLLKFVDTAYSQYMQSETMSLNDVSKEFLNDTKSNFEFKSSTKMSDEDWKDYFIYNLQDSDLTYRLFFKFWPDIREFSRVLQEPSFEISRNGMSKNVESFIIHNLDRFNEIPEKRPTHDEIGERRTREKYEGAFVFQPIPGLYENLAIFDFTSFWPSIIATFNLSKSTILEKKEKNSLEVDIGKSKIFFNKSPGFFPEMLKEIILLRKKYKQELKIKEDAITKARSNAFKLLANASYGYQGFFGARYYCPEASAATTGLSRDFIKDIINKIDKAGYRTIYSDTDSIAFLLDKKTEAETTAFLKELNKKLPGIMELELEGFFKRGIWVTKRAGDIGAKKKYALVSKDNKLKIRGFETVRRDWCRLARETQNKVLRMILEDGNEKKALIYIKEIIKKIRERKIDRKEILIRTQLKKQISEYKNISPHVIAAKKMQEQKIPIDEGALIEYFIAETREKKKLVREKVKLVHEKGEYDIKYYLEKQLLPAVENIMQVFNVDIRQIIENKKQDKLSKWI
jgi:DNA polymerase I/DNA polymerase-2